MTQYIKAPFNFVPLNEKVYFPDWADKISHDIPFSDGESGEIELELTAQTPVFVRNGYTRAEAENKGENYKSFSKDAAGNYFIPATSIKGMIRNVLEIMSFGKMGINKSMRFAQRDWKNPELYDLKNADTQNLIRCGWLEIDGEGNGTITDCETPKRINHVRIDEFFRKNNINLSFENFFSKQGIIDLTKEQKIKNNTYDPKNAAYKYALMEDKGFALDKLSGMSFVEDDRYNCPTGNKKFGFTGERYKVANGAGEFKGTIVFTGQPDNWKGKKREDRGQGAGKFYEFIFREPGNDAKKYPMDKKTIDQYRFIYKDSQAWNMFKSREKIPVFFRAQKGEVQDWGLALLYRLPYRKGVRDILDTNQGLEKDCNYPDMAECLFGFTNKTKALKSRVQFSHFKAVGNPKPMDELKTTLGSPKPSYYPIYVRQTGGDGKVESKQEKKGDKFEQRYCYAHYNSDGVTLAGWKRYPVKDNATPLPTNNSNLDVLFKPLPVGTKFTGKVRFHNLRPVEIGALLSAVSFHGNHNQLFHNIGMGKPLGYGKLKIEKINVKINGDEREIKPFLIDCEETLDDFCQNEFSIEWSKKDTIVELFSMAEGVDPKNLELLNYMKMDVDGRNNEFEKAKANGEFLQRFSKLTGKAFPVESLYAPVKEEREEKRKVEIKKEVEEQIKVSIEQIDKEFPEYLEKIRLFYERWFESSKTDIETDNKKFLKGFESALFEIKEELKESRSHAAKEEEEKATKQARRDQEALDGPNLSSAADLKGIFSRVEQWLKKHTTDWRLPAEHHRNVFEAIHNYYCSAKPREQKEFDQPQYLKKIKNWVGDVTAIEWYNQITRK